MNQKPIFPDLSSKSPVSPSKKQGCIHYEEVLNPAQLEAVTHGTGPLLVIAGAGSGKTRTLTYRVARLVENGTAPQSILLLSFTRKASQEMLRRAAELLDQRCRKVAGGTFHSFANAVLRRYSAKIGLENGFTIIDRSDSEDLIGMIRKESTTAIDERKLPRKATLANMFSRSINKALSIEEVVYEDYPHFGYQLETIAEMMSIYQQRKIEHDFCDYDDLLVYLHQLLSEHEDIRERLSSKYHHLLVDEYQDTNLIQAEIVSLLAGPEKNVMVVGDDSQSIYAFRGANFKNIITFPDRFPGTRIIKLEENYRSLQPILDVTNAMIDEAAEKYSKRLFTTRGGGMLPNLVACISENAQSQYIATEILRSVRQGVPLKDMAVLFRASFHSFDLELELARHSIPFIKYGGFKFTESAHIKDVIAHLKILLAPKDRLSWYRVLRLLKKVGPKTAQKIYDAVCLQGKGACGLLTIPIKVNPASGIDRLKELIDTITDNEIPIQQMGEAVLQYYLPYLKERYDDHPKRLRDLQQLVTIMERYDDLDDFFADMALEPPNASADGQLTTDEQTNRLNLSTVHSAKGLEWHTVFVIWALDGRFPSHHAIDNPDALEEERRLLYVAATRAQEKLTMTYPCQIFDRTTQTVLYRPSRFLEGIPDEMMEKQYFNPMT
ncbi:MAG: ATP-dependent helicase [Desulfobacteraceae bacterium]|jgi:DNA helicase II / ATP-dependent DNA helicase PcrA